MAAVAQSTDLHDLRARDPTLDALAGDIQDAAARACAAFAEEDLGALPGRVLVTGSSGYLGAALVKTLRLRGVDVVGIDVRPGETTTVVGAVEDEAAVLGAMAGCGGVLHTAALHAPHDAMCTEEDFTRVNVRGTASVLAAAKAVGSAVIFSSTTSLTITLGVKDRAATGEAVWISKAEAPAPGRALAPQDAPRNKYGRTKLVAEGLCQDAASAGMDVVILRVGRCFPEDVLEENAAPLPSIKANELLGRRAALVDVLQAQLRALARAELCRGETLTLVAPFPIPRAEAPRQADALAALIAERYPDAVRLFEARGWPLAAGLSRIQDSSATVDKLGWRPQWDFDQLLAKLEAGDEAANSGRY